MTCSPPGSPPVTQTLCVCRKNTTVHTRRRETGTTDVPGIQTYAVINPGWGASSKIQTLVKETLDQVPVAEWGKSA